MGATYQKKITLEDKTLSMKTSREQTRPEELANAVTHGMGIVFALIAMPFVLSASMERGYGLAFLSVLVFGLGMLMVYSFSTMYHYAKNEKWKRRLLIMDHISIYFLIAGTYTPLMIKYLDPLTSTIFLGIMWAMVLVASILKIFYIDRFEMASLILYILMGWMLVFVFKPLLANMPVNVFTWILAGGILYCIGVYFYVKSHKMYYHAVWHVFVLLGSISHFISIYLSV